MVYGIVPRVKLFEVLKSLGIHQVYVDAIKQLYKEYKAKIKQGQLPFQCLKD